VRIVSLLPSATETVALLGREKDLVGRSSECDAPASVRSLPEVMRPRTWDAERSSADIDARVRSVRSAGQSLYELDVPLLARLRPDLILTQDLCGVCSVTEAEVAAACAQAGLQPSILSLTPRSLVEVGATIEAIGRAVGTGPRAARLARELRRTEPPPTSAPRPRVAVVEWLDPPILAGLWTSEMVDRAGGFSVGPPAGAVGERTRWSEIRRRRPEIVVLAPCSFSLDRTVRELDRTRLGAELLELRTPGGVWIADEAYFSRPGPRLAQGIALLRALLGRGGRDRPMAVQRWDPPRAERGVAG
jgi:iron complex transport system substrate-binding protein